MESRTLQSTETTASNGHSSQISDSSGGSWTKTLKRRPDGSIIIAAKPINPNSGPSGGSLYRDKNYILDAATIPESYKQSSLKQGSPEMPASDHPTREEMQAHLHAVSAQNDAKFAGVDAKFAEVLSEIRAMRTEFNAELNSVRSEVRAVQTEVHAVRESAPSRWTIWGAAFTIIATLFAAGLGVLSFGGDRFNSGIQFSGVAIERAMEAERQADENRRQIQALSGDVKALIDTLRASGGPAPSGGSGQGQN